MAEHDENITGNQPRDSRPPDETGKSPIGDFSGPRKRVEPSGRPISNEQLRKLGELARESARRDAADKAADAARSAALVGEKTPAKKVKKVVVAQPEEPPKSTFQSILDSATQKLSEKSGIVDNKPTIGRLPENATPQQEFATLVSGIIVIISTAANLPKEVKPSDEETSGLAYHISNIFMRHIPLKAGLSADVFDVLGIMAVLASWYSRAAPYMNLNKKEKRPSWVTTDTRNTTPTDDISQVDPAVSDFLNPKKRSNGNER